MDVQIMDLPAARLACLRHIGPYGPALEQFWQQRMNPWIAAQGLQGRAKYGIALDDQSQTSPTECRYDAGVEVPADFSSADAQVLLRDLPAGRYAVLAFCGRADQIGAAWDELCCSWLPAHGWQMGPSPAYERYDHPDFVRPAPDAALDTAQFCCQICVPVCVSDSQEAVCN